MTGPRPALAAGEGTLRNGGRRRDAVPVWRRQARRFLGHYRGSGCNPCAIFVRRRFARVTALLGTPPDGLLVDLGCGDGYYLSRLAATSAPRLGLDFSLNMLRAAAAPAGFSRVNADARAVPVRTAAAAVVLAIGVANYVHEVDRMLAECRRLLRPGGLLLLTFPRGATVLTRLRGIGALQKLREAWLGLAPVVNYANTAAALAHRLQQHGLAMRHCEVLRIAGVFDSEFLCVASAAAMPD